VNMKVSFEILQEAFIQNQITVEQFIEVLVDNFGAKKTRKILRKNLQLALEKECKAALHGESKKVLQEH